MPLFCSACASSRYQQVGIRSRREAKNDYFKSRRNHGYNVMVRITKSMISLTWWPVAREGRKIGRHSESSVQDVSRYPTFLRFDAGNEVHGLARTVRIDSTTSAFSVVDCAILQILTFLRELRPEKLLTHTPARISFAASLHRVSPVSVFLVFTPFLLFHFTHIVIFTHFSRSILLLPSPPCPIPLFSARIVTALISQNGKVCSGTVRHCSLPQGRSRGWNLLRCDPRRAVPCRCSEDADPA